MKTRATLLVLTLGFSLSAFASPLDQPWDEFNDPSKISTEFNYKFDELKLKASVKDKSSTKGWSGSYWPDYRGSIARRSSMQSNKRIKHPDLETKELAFGYETPSLEILKTMDEKEIQKLSPAEKLDIMAGRYNYPLLADVYLRANKSDPAWEGICHGWSPAAINHEEPKPVTLTNEDGIKIPFGASDIKGLLSYFYAYHAPEPAINVALRCNSFLRWGKACKGINPGTLHIMLTNMIGENQEGFVVDITRGKQVWNQPVMGYRSIIVKDDFKIKNKHLKKGIHKLIKVRTKLNYLVETHQNWNQVPRRTKSIMLGYTLELNNRGEVIGGEWDSATRLDFAWVLKKQSFSSVPMFEILEDIYKASLEQEKK